MSPEVLVYIQTIKKYFEKNEETKNYFIGESDEEIFFEFLADISQKNYEENKEPMLTQVQFELLRIAMSVNKVMDEKPKTDDSPFINIGEYGDICLN
jgi:hypothetical protein